MKLQPQIYTFERGDIIAHKDHDAVGILTNQGWKFSNQEGIYPFERAIEWMNSGNWVYLGNRVKGLTSAI